MTPDHLGPAADEPTLGCDTLAGTLRGVRSGVPAAIARGIRQAIRRVDRPRENDCSVLAVQRAG